MKPCPKRRKPKFSKNDRVMVVSADLNGEKGQIIFVDHQNEPIVSYLVRIRSRDDWEHELWFIEEELEFLLLDTLAAVTK